MILSAAGLALPPVCDRESQYFCIRTVVLDATSGDQVRLMVIDHLAHGISGETEPRRMFTEHAAMLDSLSRMRMNGRDFWFAPETARVLHEDARRALNRSDRRFDVIVGDAFTDIAVPAHLVTREFFALVRDRLTPDGIYAMNLIDDTDRLAALASMVATLRTAFPSVEVWTEARPPEPGERRVFVLLAGAEDSPVSQIDAAAPDVARFAALAPGFVDRLTTRPGTVVLSDDYAPIDRLVGMGTLID